MNLSCKILLTIILEVCFVKLHAQCNGCNDPQVRNFTTNATENDGSCKYPFTDFNPPFDFSLPEIVTESSSLVFFRDRLWTTNDSGGKPVIYALDTLTGQVVQEITVAHVKNVDWEELTMDHDYLYIGDFGNNSGSRTDLKIYKVLLNEIPIEKKDTVHAGIITFTYPDQKSFDRNFNHNFDCEAFVATEDSLYLFSKNREDQQTKVYSLPKQAGNYVADLKTTFDARGLITGAAYNMEENELALVGYVQNIYTPFVWLLSEFQSDDFFGGNKRRIDFPNLISVQTEGICFVKEDKMKISAERSRTTGARVFDLDIARWNDLSYKPERHKHSHDPSMQIVGKPESKAKLTLLLCNIPKGSYRIDVTDFQESIIKQFTIEPDRLHGKSFEIDLPELVEGTYSISLISSKVMLSETFVIE
ncbi:MAG: hypothetical protein HOO86_08575 [Bacteroidales bacterium]|nr:hypothetical protein [Bacteroidales bacterium]